MPPRTPPQQQPPQQGPPPTFQVIRVWTDEGSFNHPYAQHSINMSPDGGILIVQETRDEKICTVYPLTRVQRVAMTPTKLSLA